LGLLCNGLADRREPAFGRGNNQDPELFVLEKLFESSTDLTITNLVKFAEALKLDTTSFQACLDNKQMVARIREDTVDAGVAGLAGTPSFVLGRSSEGKITGVVIEGAKPYSIFDAEVKRLLKSENVWLRAGALRGLAETEASGVRDLLIAAAAADQPALARQEALVQLRLHR